MTDEPTRVWIRKRKRESGKVVYDLRWVCPVERKWKSRKVGTDSKRAKYEAAKLEAELAAGVYRDIKKTRWAAFVDEVVAFRSGRHAEEVRRALKEFADVCDPASPKMVRRAMVRDFVQHCRDKGNAVATVNTKLRCLRLAFREAVSLDYMAKSPMDGWEFQKAPKRTLRILTADEEVKLIESATKLYGFKMTAFIRFTLTTWARFGEATGLQWADVDLEGPSVCFRSTKSHEDRFVPIAPEAGLLDDLRRLQVQTMIDGGPFVDYANRSMMAKRWTRIIADADIPHLSRHDLRRTAITRALLAGMPPVVAQKLAGHADIKTTMEYYVEVEKADLRAAVAKLAAGGA